MSESKTTHDGMLGMALKARGNDSVNEQGSWLDSRRFMGVVFLAPALLYIVLLIGMPFVTAILYSLSDATVGNTSFSFVGLRNFERVWANPIFHQALRNSFVITVIAQIFVLILANILALVLTTPLPHNRWARGGGCGSRAC